MKYLRYILPLLILVVVSAPRILFARDQESGDPIGGARLAAQLRQMTPSTNASWTGTLIRKLPDYKREKTAVSCQIFVKPDEWSAQYNAGATEHTPAEKLTVVHHDNGKIDYFMWTAGKDGKFTGGPTRVRNEETMVPFAGSDFYLSDFGMEFFQWPTQLLMAGQMRRGRPCFVLDSISPRPDGKGYYRVRSWIDKEYLGLLQANAYDVNGKLLKEFRTKSFVPDDAGNYQLKNMEMANRRTDTETELRFDIDE